MTLSKDKPWLQFYPDGAFEEASQVDCNRTMWEYLEGQLNTVAPHVPAIQYFGRNVSRKEFIDMVYRWAAMFKGMGIKPDERVVLFSPFTLEVATMIFGLNIVGASWIMPNMASSKEAIAQSVSDASYAVVFDGLYDRMSLAFERKDFKKVIIIEADNEMPMPIRFLAHLANIGKHRKVMNDDKAKNITTRQAMKLWGKKYGEVRVPFRKERVAFVTASGGTTKSGEAKLIQTTNETVIRMTNAAFCSRGENYQEGSTCLNMLPPFVSTSLFVLFIAPLASGGTVIIEPRLSPEMFVKSIFKFRPAITLMPGKGWEYYFKEVKRQKDSGKNPDLSHWRLPIIGGEGMLPEDFLKCNELLKECSSPTNLVSGYGMSEVFSVATVDFQHFNYDPRTNYRDCIQVGIPMAGFTVGIFDEDGNELPLGHRGELWIKSPTMMAGYLNNEELTRKIKSGGWIHTGDLFESDENGVLFCYGRMEDSVIIGGRRIFFFDIANRMRHDKDVYQVIVTNNSHSAAEKPVLIAHIILYKESHSERDEVISRLKADMNDWLPEGIDIHRYIIHDEPTFRTSPVMKTDKNYYKRYKIR